MKKLTFIVLLFPLYTLAQNCKYDVNTYDKFLNIKKLEKEVKVNKADALGNGYLTITLCKYDTSTFFRITYIRKGGVVVGPQEAVMFLFEDDSSIKAFPNQIYSGNSRSSTNQFVLNATYNFDSPGAIALLKTKDVKAIRIYYNDVYHDYDIKDKFSQTLQEAAKCF